MTKFNKSLLTMAVVGALALPGLASAASMAYSTAAPGKQITFAKDLIVNDGTTLTTSDELRLTATANDAARVTTIGAGDTMRVKVTLANGAKFDSTAPANVIVAAFNEGVQTGGGPNVLNVVGTPYYSASGQELNFEYTTTGAGAMGAAGDYFLELNTMQITNLLQGLFVGNSVSAEITVQDDTGTQILAASAVIAKSKWGVTIDDVASPDALAGKTIDVAADPRKTWFAPTGVVGQSNGAPAGYDYFNAGGFELDITEDTLTGANGVSYINNYSALTGSARYNVVGTANITVAVNGTNLASFAATAGGAWLDNVATCNGPDAVSLGWAAAAPGTLSAVVSANDPLWLAGGVANTGIAAAPPSPSTVYVCLGADGDAEMDAQALAGSVAINYNLPTQRVNPAPMEFALSPLLLNGSTIIFQNVNPGGNATAQSFLRLTNNNADVCPVVIDAKDDAGLLSDEVKLTLAKHASIQLNSDQLENGSDKATGAFGDGTGKWYVRVTAECSNFNASALNRHQDGVITDLTPERPVGNVWLTPDDKL